MNNTNTIMEKITQKGANFLGVKYPIICGAMTWVSNPNLVATVCEAGAFASLAGGNNTVEGLRSEIIATRELTDKPFGVNFITIAPAYQDQLQLAREMKIPFVIFAGSFPKEKEVRSVKECGCKVICFASTLSIAKRMLAYGADALILEGMEAGGHVGHVSLMVLLQQVLFEISEVPIFVAGGIASGKMAAHLFLMGAAGIQMGTVFAASKESCAHVKFKEKMIRSNARDAVSTPQYDSKLPVVAVRSLKNMALADFGKLQLDLISKIEQGQISSMDAQIKVEEFWMGALKRAVIDGDIDRGSMMAGQSVGLVKSILSVKEIIENFYTGAENELLNMGRFFNQATQ